VVGRRGLLVGGGAALLAVGCGKDREISPPPATEPALLRSLAAERALGAAMAGEKMPALAQRSRARATQLAAALSARGARPHDAPDTATGGDALGRGQAALEAYVALLPALGRGDRGLGADLLTGAAGDVALMASARGAPPVDAFPGTPS
jgi:hypothetical protein